MKKQRVWVGMTAVDKIVGDPPCKGCLDRSSGCGAKCPLYANWKDKRKREQEAYFRANRADLEVERYKMDSYHKMQRHKGEKVKEL